ATILQEKRGHTTGKKRPPRPQKLGYWRETLAQPPQRDRKPRQPPALPCGGLICSANSSATASSSIPGSSGGRTMGMTGGMLDEPDLGISCRCRKSGAAVGVSASVGAEDRAAVGASAASTLSSFAAEPPGKLSCAGGFASIGGSR